MENTIGISRIDIPGIHRIVEGKASAERALYENCACPLRYRIAGRRNRSCLKKINLIRLLTVVMLMIMVLE
jgi:hypothetical protein